MARAIIGGAVVLLVAGLVVLGLVLGKQDPPTAQAPAPSVSPTAPAKRTATATASSGVDVGPTSFPRQFAPTSFWNARIPDDVAFATDTLDVGGEPQPVNPTVGAELAAYARRDAGSSNTWVNYDKYTSRVVVVPPDQPLVPVKLCRDPKDCVPSYAGGLDKVLRGVGADGKPVGGGVPIPRNVPMPAEDDTDASIVIYQPGYRAPDGKKGRLYELWQFRDNTDFDAGRPVGPGNTRYTASWGGRLVGVNGQGVGHYRDCFYSGCGTDADTQADPSAWGKPDSQAQDKSWGVTASSMPMTASQMNLADCVRGGLNHGIGIEVPQARRSTVWWPAQRTDGFADDKVLSEGMRLTFRRSAKPPGSLTTVGRALWDAAYRYGLVIDDQSASSLNFRAEPGCEKTKLFRDALSVVGRESLMRDFPWQDLRVIKQGSDDDPNPTR